MDRKTGNRKSGRMCLTMDANRALSQLSYRPKSALFMRKKLRILDFSNIRFSWESPTNQSGKRGHKPGSDVSRYGCERSALPAELRAQIDTFYTKKVAEFGFQKYSIFRGKVQRIGLKNGATNLGRMCLTMDANAALSQLSYEPKSTLFIRKKLQNLDFKNIRFSGEKSNGLD